MVKLPSLGNVEGSFPFLPNFPIRGNIGFMRLRCAMIFVNDLPRMTAFYADALCLKPVESTREEDYLEFDAGGATFALHAIPAEMRRDQLSPVTPREKTPLKLIFEVPDVDSEVRRLESVGVTLLRRPWGGCDAVDPEGNVFGISAAA